MATLVCFHAHPDDEAISTGGLMAKAAAAGHRVVLVCATRGEVGEPQPGVLQPGEQLWERRMVELAKSAKILGAEEPRWLGYQDSGMAGESTNDNPASFWRADHQEATERLTTILAEVEADVLTIYDSHGGYGHPDHIRVHTVGKAAAEAANISGVFEATINRDHIKAITQAQQDQAEPGDTEGPNIDLDTAGTATSDISYRVNVESVIDAKRAAMVAHRSQIGPDSLFLAMPTDLFTTAFGSEWFNIPGHTQTQGPIDTDLLPGLS